MLWWVISLALLVASFINKVDTTLMLISGIFAIAGAITYVGSTIGTIFKKGNDKDA